MAASSISMAFRIDTTSTPRLSMVDATKCAVVTMEALVGATNFALTVEPGSKLEFRIRCGEAEDSATAGGQESVHRGDTPSVHSPSQGSILPEADGTLGGAESMDCNTANSKPGADELENNATPVAIDVLSNMLPSKQTTFWSAACLAAPYEADDNWRAALHDVLNMGAWTAMDRVSGPVGASGWPSAMSLDLSSESERGVTVETRDQSFETDPFVTKETQMDGRTLVGIDNDNQV